MIFDEDPIVQREARKVFIKYIESVMMSTYGDDLMMTYPCHCDNEPEKIYVDIRNNMFDSVELQDLRNM